jgi:hypothetical protein
MVYTISHSRLIFVHTQRGGGGKVGTGSGGESRCIYKNRGKVRSLQICGSLFADWRQTSEHFLPELKDVAFCI